ncbi:hypothetical protein GCM10028824_42990 [Hymenobacter segetis]
MPRHITSLLHSLTTFQLPESRAELDDLLAELWEHAPTQEAPVLLFRFLERFPTDDIGGVLTSACGLCGLRWILRRMAGVARALP